MAAVWLDRAGAHRNQTKERKEKVNSNQINDGGPAFPAEEWSDSMDPSTINPTRHVGMTLRDYFAAAVMTGLCASDTVLEKANQVDEDLDVVLADMAYQAADSMIAHRAKGGAQ